MLRDFCYHFKSFIYNKVYNMYILYYFRILILGYKLYITINCFIELGSMFQLQI